MLEGNRFARASQLSFTGYSGPYHTHSGLIDEWSYMQVTAGAAAQNAPLGPGPVFSGRALKLKRVMVPIGVWIGLLLKRPAV